MLLTQTERKREKERETDRDRDRERQTETETKRERERERDEERKYNCSLLRVSAPNPGQSPIASPSIRPYRRKTYSDLSKGDRVTGINQD